MPHRSRLVTLVLAASLAGAAPASAAEFVPGEVIVQHEGETAPEIVSLDAGETVPEAVADLEAAPGVDYAVPNYKARASVIWNDPGRSGEPEGWTNLQWNFIGDASINAPDAWDLAAPLGAPGGAGRRGRGGGHGRRLQDARPLQARSRPAPLDLRARLRLRRPRPAPASTSSATARTSPARSPSA